MGNLVRNTSTGWIGAYMDPGVPPFDPETEEIIQCEADEVEGLKPQAQIDAQAAAIVSARRAEADSLIDLDGPTGVVMRSLVKAVVDEFNDLRSWVTDFKVEVAAATSLGDLKTRVAGLPNMPARTKAQVVSVLKTENASGNSDGA